MWGGVDPDTQLYASGRVLDDAGDWAVGQSLTEAPGGPSVCPCALTCLRLHVIGGILDP